MEGKDLDEDNVMYISPAVDTSTLQKISEYTDEIHLTNGPSIYCGGLECAHKRGALRSPSQLEGQGEVGK